MNDPHTIMDTRLIDECDKDKQGDVKPHICLSMPLYNQTKFLEEALQSLLAQTYRDFRLIVVDDSTELAPGETVKRFA